MTAVARPFERVRWQLPQPDLVRDGTLLLGFAAGITAAFRLWQPNDALLYWQASLDHLYPNRWTDTFPQVPYPPVLVQIIAPLHLFGWGVFVTLDLVLCFAALWYLARNWTPLLVALGVFGMFVPGPWSVFLGWAMLGNVQLPIAAAIVLGMRHPSWWALPALTKIGPGIGLLWFLVRGEWRALAIALGTILVVVAVSFALSPSLWFDWFAFAARNSDLPTPIPVVPIAWPVRLAMSLVLLAWGARTDRAWTVPIACGWAIPALYVWSFLPIWLGALQLSRSSASRTVTTSLSPSASALR